MTSVCYRASLLNLGLLATGTYQWILCGDTYVPDVDADVHVDDLTDEYTGGSYTRQPWVFGAFTPATDGNQLISAGSMPSFDLDNDSVHLSSLVLAEDSGTDSADLLVAQFGIDKSGDGTTYTPLSAPDGLIVQTSTADLSLLAPPGPGDLAYAVAWAQAKSVRSPHVNGIIIGPTTSKQRAELARTPPPAEPLPLPGVPWLVKPGGYRPPA